MPNTAASPVVASSKPDVYCVIGNHPQAGEMRTKLSEWADQTLKGAVKVHFLQEKADMTKIAENIKAKPTNYYSVLYCFGDAQLLEELLGTIPDKATVWFHSFTCGVDKSIGTIRKFAGSTANGPKKLNIVLTNGKGAFSGSLCEYVIGSMLYFNKQIPRLIANHQQAKWEPFKQNKLKGKTVGFLALGDIASAIVPFVLNFNMKAICMEKRALPEWEGKVTPYNLDTDKKKFFQDCDFIISTLPSTKSTYHYIGEEEFSVMKKTAVFINIGRGDVVDEDAIARALNADKFAGAALDVFEKEPLPATSPLWKVSPNKLIISPHNTDLTADGLQIFFDNFERVQPGSASSKTGSTDALKGALKNLVDIDAGF